MEGRGVRVTGDTAAAAFALIKHSGCQLNGNYQQTSCVGSLKNCSVTWHESRHDFQFCWNLHTSANSFFAFNVIQLAGPSYISRYAFSLQVAVRQASNRGLMRQLRSTVVQQVSFLMTADFLTALWTALLIVRLPLMVRVLRYSFTSREHVFSKLMILGVSGLISCAEAMHKAKSNFIK